METYKCNLCEGEAKFVREQSEQVFELDANQEYNGSEPVETLFIERAFLCEKCLTQ